MRYRWIRRFREIDAGDVALVGGKNASLGEMFRELSAQGVRVPDGFAVTADAYRHYLRSSGIGARLERILAERVRGDDDDLVRRSEEVRRLFDAPLPDDLLDEIAQAYEELGDVSNVDSPDVAVRSSATAEDLPTASFAGQQESFLNVRGAEGVVDAVRRAFASLFSPRAISYREDMGFEHSAVALSAGVQRMVRSDRASAGVVFTLDPETGHDGVVLVTSSWGFGESVVQGAVAPDQFYVHKTTLEQGYAPVVWKRLGTKATRVVAAGDAGVRTEQVPEDDRRRFSLDDEEVLELSRSALRIERHYSRRAGRWMPMDIEWAKDGDTGELFIVQARPETVHGAGPHVIRVHHLETEAEPLVEGVAVGTAIATGTAKVLRDPRAFGQFPAGAILVTEQTDPDWEPVMKRAGAIVTALGGRTAHAAIVARELGIPAVVGAKDALERIVDGDDVTVSCAEGTTGHVYPGRLPFHVEEIDASRLERPQTKMMVNLADPERAFAVARLPSEGVGLLRMEFVFAGWVRVHPLALTRFDTLDETVRAQVEAVTGGGDKRAFFVDRLAQGIGTIAAAFHPRPVILRFSDFKTNEYARLVGGQAFEPHEENPMLGWRGASRYSHPGYRDGFLLEVEAVRRVREVFGLKNLQAMIPFCRTPAEGRRVLETLAQGGLVRGRDGFEVYVMAEIPSNVLLAEAFAADFDGFSIGSNDLTQLTLGIDRDSATVAPLFDEQNEAVRWSCAHLIEAAHRAGRHVGICGQAPSDFPEFAAFLVERGIDSISLTPDALLRTTLKVLEVERERERRSNAELTWMETTVT